MIKGIHHIALVVEDVETVLPYYRGAAGLTRLADADALAITPEHPATGDAAVRCLLAGPNAYLKLLSPQQSHNRTTAGPDPINRPGIRHFCVQNHDCATLEAAVHDNGGSLIAPPLDLGTGNQYAYARDPEGNILEIEGLPYAPAGEPTWMGHVAIVTRDMDAAIAFYSALFAAEPNSRGRFGPGPQFDTMGGLVDAQIEGAWLPTGNILLELWQFHAPSYPADNPSRKDADRGYSHVCLETDDLAGDAARLQAIGGALTSGVTENEAVSTIFVADPEGNAIQLLQFHEPDGRLSIAALDKPGLCALIDSSR